MTPHNGIEHGHGPQDLPDDAVYCDVSSLSGIPSDLQAEHSDLIRSIENRIRQYEILLVQDSAARVMAHVDEIPDVVVDGPDANSAIISLMTTLRATCLDRVLNEKWTLPNPKRDRKSVLMSVRVPAVERERFRRLAIQHNMTLSELVRHSLTVWEKQVGI